MLSDVWQKIILSGRNEIIGCDFLTEAVLAEYIIEHNLDGIIRIYLWTVDEGTALDISEDIAEAWIKSMEESVNAVIEESQCPYFVAASMAWHNYKEEQGV